MRFQYLAHIDNYRNNVMMSRPAIKRIIMHTMSLGILDDICHKLHSNQKRRVCRRERNDVL